jgi:peptide/nickel transport system substrate-binding protein
MKNPLFYERRKGNALPYLEAVAITLPDKQSGFCHTRKIDFTSGLDPSYKDDIHKRRIAAQNTKTKLT